MEMEFFTQKERDEIVSYGIWRIKNTCSMIITMLLIGCIFHAFFQSIIFFICFIPLRKYAGGYHADTQIRCYIISTMIFVMACIFMKCVPPDDFWLLFIQYTCLLVLWLFAPVEHENHKLENQEKQNYKQKSRQILSGIYIGIIICNITEKYDIAIAMRTSIIVTGICILMGMIKELLRRIR